MEILELKKHANDVRKGIIEAVHGAKAGHPGGSLSAADIFTYLYFEEMNIDPANPKKEDRDRFVLSKGHATVALYPVLAHRGFFPLETLKTFRKLEGELSGHAEMRHVPGVDMSTGSLGQGFSAAVGMAEAGKLSGRSYTTYAVLGDGEIAEGQIWEACMFAAARGLDNLTGILDSNKVQLDGTVQEVLDTGDLRAKFESFGFYVQSIDGHKVEEVAGAIDKAKACKGKPSMIIANTVKGKGVSFMEGNHAWHGKTPDEKQFAQAFEELEAALKEL